MTYSVELALPAARALIKLDRKARLRLVGAIELLSVQPRPPAAKMLRGGDDVRWRVRIGDYRIVYTIEDDRLVVLVLRLGHRRDVYDR